MQQHKPLKLSIQLSHDTSRRLVANLATSTTYTQHRTRERARVPAKNREHCEPSNRLPGDQSVVEPPDPIPNSEVKRNRADGSVALPCKSRSSPGALPQNAGSLRVRRSSFGRSKAGVREQNEIALRQSRPRPAPATSACRTARWPSPFPAARRRRRGCWRRSSARCWRRNPSAR